MKQEICTVIITAVLSLLSAYGAYALNVMSGRIRAQTQKLKSGEQRELLDNAVTDVEYLATKTVQALEQTTAQYLREQVHRQKADRRELLALGSLAADEVAKAIRPEARRIIEQHFGSFRDYVTKCVEAKVLELKEQSLGGA